MDGDILFAIEVGLSGFMTGMLYALVALGFVLIYKASGIFNFAQGALVFFAGLTFVRFLEMGVNFTLAVLITTAIIMVFAVLIEMFVLRKLVNQELIILFMATIGLNFFIEGLTELVWDSNSHALSIEDKTLGFAVPDAGIDWIWDTLGLGINQIDVVATLVAILMLIGLTFFFNKTRVGRALRAVADDHQAAMSVGIPLQTIWAVTWAFAGLIALVAAIFWGSKVGVQFSLSQLALKALPVLIIGGFDSIAGAVVGGLVIGFSENMFEIYVGEFIGGGTTNWFPYALATVFLLFRPQGLFGLKIIERV